MTRRRTRGPRRERVGRVPFSYTTARGMSITGMARARCAAVSAPMRPRPPRSPRRSTPNCRGDPRLSGRLTRSQSQNCGNDFSTATRVIEDLDQDWLHVRGKPELWWRVKTRQEPAVPLVKPVVNVLWHALRGRQAGSRLGLVILTRRYEKATRSPTGLVFLLSLLNFLLHPAERRECQGPADSCDGQKRRLFEFARR